MNQSWLGSGNLELFAAQSQRVSRDGTSNQWDTIGCLPHMTFNNFDDNYNVIKVNVFSRKSTNFKEILLSMCE